MKKKNSEELSHPVTLRVMKLAAFTLKLFSPISLFPSGLRNDITRQATLTEPGCGTDEVGKANDN